MQARGISAGVTRDGVVHRKMTLLPEIDAKFETLMNAYLNPRSKPTFNDPDPDAPKDPRATAQARHDVFASLIDGAARSADSPRLAGRHRRCSSPSDRPTSTPAPGPVHRGL